MHTTSWSTPGYSSKELNGCQLRHSAPGLKRGFDSLPSEAHILLSWPTCCLAICLSGLGKIANWVYRRSGGRYSVRRSIVGVTARWESSALRSFQTPTFESGLMLPASHVGSMPRKKKPLNSRRRGADRGLPYPLRRMDMRPLARYNSKSIHRFQGSCRASHLKAMSAKRRAHPAHCAFNIFSKSGDTHI